MYSVGKIPGGFKKREGRPSDKAILTSRLIDRPLRPLFPKGFYNDVSVVIVLNAYSGELQGLTAENIYADIAFADGFPALRKAVEFFPASRMLFGSHAPFFCVNAALSKLQYEKLTPEIIDRMVSGNIERILDER